ncbi:MAG: protein-tyrosine phosphatase family protein [Bacteroidota bacterium]
MKSLLQVCFSLSILSWMAIYDPSEPIEAEPQPMIQQASVTATTVKTLSSPESAKVMPTGDWLGGTQCREDLRQFKESGGEVVWRLNGNSPARERGCMSIAEERLFVEDSLGLIFIYSNIEGRVESMAIEIGQQLHDHKVLVHCRNGRHRAPTMMGWYLINYLNYDAEKAQRTVGVWDIINSTQYAKYFWLLK